MRARRLLLVLGLFGAPLAACNAALDVLASAPPEDGSANDGAAPSDDGATGDAGEGGDAAATDDGWPGPPGTVVPIATGLAGAVDIDVDDAFVYVAIGGQDGGVVRVPKHGGATDPIALHQASPSAVRAATHAVVWTLQPGVAPAEPSVMALPRDGGAPAPLLVGGYNAGALSADGDRVAWVDHQGGQGRLMVAELDKGSARPIVDMQLGVGGTAIAGDRVAWTAKCNANVCGTYVMASPIGAPAAAPVWSTTSISEMGGIAIACAPPCARATSIGSGTIAFSYGSAQGAHFARLAGAPPPVDYPGALDAVSAPRVDGDAIVLLARSGGDLALTRVRADGSAAPSTLTTSPGASGAVAPDGPAIYWISHDEGVLRAIRRP